MTASEMAPSFKPSGGHCFPPQSGKNKSVNVSLAALQRSYPPVDADPTSDGLFRLLAELQSTTVVVAMALFLHSARPDQTLVFGGGCLPNSFHSLGINGSHTEKHRHKTTNPDSWKNHLKGPLRF